MHVTDALVRQVAKLARIELSDAEVAAMVPQLDRILGHVEAASLDRAKDVMRNAPEKDTMGVFFLVPKVLED